MRKNRVRDHANAVIVIFSLVTYIMASPPQFESDVEATTYLEAHNIAHSLDGSGEHVEQVTFDKDANFDELICRLQGLKHLRKLAFDGDSVTPERIKTVGIKCPDIIHLHIEDIGQVTVAVYREISGLKGLRSLSRFSPLIIDLDRAHVSLHDPDANAAEKLSAVFTLVRLESLYLARLSVTGIDFSPIQHLKSLDTLDLSQTELADDQLRHVGQLKKLMQLNLAYTKVTDAGVQHLEDLQKLQYLCLWDNPGITDKCAPSLLKLRSLDDLEIMDTEIGDEALRVLTKHPALRKLHIAGTWVTDEGLMALAGLQSLKYLNVEVTKVTPAAVDRLQRALPHCRIVTNPPESMGMGRER